MLNRFHIFTISHKEVALEQLPGYALNGSDEEALQHVLTQLKSDLNFDEFFYLNTCNRILFLAVGSDIDDLHAIKSIFPQANVDLHKVKHLQGANAIHYLFQVAASIHSLVVGEREILKQIRVAYELQSSYQLTGDLIRLAIQQTIRTAKQVYAKTKIGERPVSVVSLAVQKLLKSFELKKDARFLVVGAGSTIQLLLKHMTKKGYRNFSIYNRSSEKAAGLMRGLKGRCGDLKEFLHHPDPFDCVIACTGSQEPIISFELGNKLTNGKMGEKVWLDLGIPPDVSKEIQTAHPDRFIGVETLKNMAESNMQFRLVEAEKADEILTESLDTFQHILYQRKVEKAFQIIPEEIKSVRQKAVDEVFRKDLAELDDKTQDLVKKMLVYMEKKCISIPMKAAKEVVF